jgi:MFS family permease
MRPEHSAWRTSSDFRRYWLGHTISQLGSEVTALALPLVALLQLGATSGQVGVLRAAAFLPFLLLTLPVGVLTDRVRRRPLMVGADLGRAVLLAVIPVAATLDALSLPLLVAVAFTVGILDVVFDVSYVSVLPGLVRREQLQSGNAALEGSRAFASIVGPGLGGALVSLLTAARAVIVDAASFLVSAACLLAIRRPEPHPEPPRERGLQALLVGWRQVAHSPLLRPITLWIGASNLAGSAFATMLVVFEVRELGLSGLAIGLVAALGNVGFLAGAGISRRLGQRAGIGSVLWAGSLISGLGMLVAASAPRAWPLPLLVVGQALFGGGIALANLQSMSLRQAITPNAVLGRANAVVRFVGWGTAPVGAAAGGVLAGVIGLRPLLVVAAAGVLLATSFLLFSEVRRIVDTPPVEPLWSSRPGG